jgi:hypothetical protein
MSRFWCSNFRRSCCSTIGHWLRCSAVVVVGLETWKMSVCAFCWWLRLVRMRGLLVGGGAVMLLLMSWSEVSLWLQFE